MWVWVLGRAAVPAPLRVRLEGVMAEVCVGARLRVLVS